MDAAPREGPLSFGPFTLDPGNARLERDGQPVELPPRSFSLLHFLAARAGRLVTKDELLDAVWGRRFITEAVIKTAVSELRAALDDDAREPRYIETVPRRGYRFVSAVGPPAAASPVADRAFALAQAAPALVGRATEQAQLASLVPAHARVTVVGPGGVGKTRLALAVAAQLLPHFADGVWLVELAALLPGDDAQAQLRIVLAQGLRLPPQAARDDEALWSAMAGLRGLVLLDNAEHVVEPVAALLQRLPAARGALHWLVTSQEPLQLPDEQLLRLAPLPLPGRPDEPDPGQLMRSDAVRLFVERVAARLPGFALAQAQQQAVHDICRLLDGLPLALELAAARVPLLGVHGLLDRLLDDPAGSGTLDLLRQGLRGAPTRHHTLRDALAWSHALLSPSEQRAFARLGVLRGSFTIDLAQSMVADEGQRPAATLDTLAALVDKSLLVADADAEPARLRLLEAPRALALERLQAMGEQPQAGRRLARAVLNRLQARVPLALQRRTFDWADEAQQDLPNLRAALAWARAQDDTEARHLQLALAAWGAPAWHAAELSPEGLRALDEAEPLLTPDAPAALRARFWLSLAQLGAATVLPARRGLAAAELAVPLLRELGDPIGEVWGLSFLLPLAFWCGRQDIDADAALARMAELVDASDPLRGRPLRITQGAQALRLGDWRAFRDAMQRELALMRQVGDARTAWLVTGNLAMALLLLDEVDEAVRVTSETVDEMRRLDRLRQGWQQVGMRAVALLHAERADEAALAFREALDLQWAAGARWRGMEHWAALLLLRGRHDDAARLYGWTSAKGEALGMPRGPLSAKAHVRTEARLIERLGERRLAMLAAEGRSLVDEQSLALLRDAL